MSEELICPSCRHDISNYCHVKINALDVTCHCTYTARDVAEKIVRDLRTERDALKEKLKIANAYLMEFALATGDEYSIGRINEMAVDARKKLEA